MNVITDSFSNNYARVYTKNMNNKLLIYLAALLLLICGCELGTNRVYMEMYEVMNVNSDAIQSSIEGRIRSIIQEVKKKPDYKPLAPAAEKIDQLTSDFTDFMERIDERLDARDWKSINDDEIKGNIIAHRHKVIDVLKSLSGNKTLWIKDKEIQNLIELHFFPNGALPLINGKPFDDYSFENQSIACNKAMLAKQKNDASMLAKIATDFLGSRIGSTIICGFNKSVVVSSPKTTFIVKGETFETNIFLYYSNNIYHNQLKIKVKVNNREIPVEYGVATYKSTPIVYGKHNYDVEIIITNPFNNKTETYRETFSFEVGERCY